MDYLLYLATIAKLVFYSIILYLIWKIFLGNLRLQTEPGKEESEDKEISDREVLKGRVVTNLEKMVEKEALEKVDSEALERIIEHNIDSNASRRRICGNPLMQYLIEKDEVRVLEFSQSIYYSESEVVSFFESLKSETGLLKEAEVEVEEIKSFNPATYSLESLQWQSSNHSAPEFNVKIQISKTFSFNIAGKFPGPKLASELNEILKKEENRDRVVLEKPDFKFNKIKFLVMKKEIKETLLNETSFS